VEQPHRLLAGKLARQQRQEEPWRWRSSLRQLLRELRMLLPGLLLRLHGLHPCLAMLADSG
jgi:hypothetical protein